MTVLALAQRSLRALVLRAVGPVDLSQIDRVPARLTWPLARDGYDPVARVGALRDVEPVSRLTRFAGITVWVVSGHAESKHVLASASYSNDIRPFVGAGYAQNGGYIGGLGFTDPPDHTRLRKLLTPEFTMRRLQRLVPRITEIVADQLDVLAQAGEDGGADLMRDFAFPIPFLVVCELLGLPAEEREKFRSLTSARFDVSAGGSGAFGAISGSREYLADFVRAQRRDPGNGLVGQILREHGDDVDDIELAGLADGAFTGGLETSASMLALGAAVLLERPGLFRDLATADEATVERVVEELLRYLSVVQIAFPRFAQEDHELGGHRIRKGDVVICHLAAADRDPRAGYDDTFDPSREPAGHLAFGHGFHRCVGAELAKMELRIAYPALAVRFPELAVATSQPQYRPTSIVYGVDSLPVTLG